MILTALSDLFERLEDDPEYEVPPPGYSYQKVSFVIVLDSNGSLSEIQDGREHDEKGKPRPKRILVPGETKKSGSGLNPCFLWDNQKYLLGNDKDKPQRAKKSFQAFRDCHLALEQAIGIEEYSAVCRFLESWRPENALNQEILEEVGNGFGVFQIRGQTRFVHEHPGIREWWEKQASKDEDEIVGECLITGESAPLARLHPSITGIYGSKSTGGSIVSFNESAYESYGKTQSYNAPVSQAAARKYVTALNSILDGKRKDKHKTVIGDTTVAFWTERPTVLEDIFLPFAQSSNIDEVTDKEVQDESLRSKIEAFMKALKQGREAYADLDEEPDKTNYFILGLAPNAARIAVRFFHRDTIAELLDNLRRHFEHIQIERQRGDETEKPDPVYPPLWLLLKQTARDFKEVPPVLSGPLLSSVMTGTFYPTGLFQAVMRRISTERYVSYPKACVVKGYLVRNLGKEITVSLDTKRVEPAYRLGRLFAALDKTQQDALKGVGATIRDRFYASASATPASIFPRILRTYQHHISKLEGGFKVNREKLVQEIIDPLESFPAHLDLADQGLFAIGYYHQMNDFYRKKEDRSE